MEIRRSTTKGFTERTAEVALLCVITITWNRMTRRTNQFVERWLYELPYKE